MSAIAVQGAVGGNGSKATTFFTNFAFNSLGIINGFSFGASKNGLFKLNDGIDDDGAAYTSLVTFATTDFSINNNKRLRYIYVGGQFSGVFTLTLSVDDESTEHIYNVTPNTNQMNYRVPIGRNINGRYWKISVSSVFSFTLDDIKILPVIRPAGITRL